MLTIRSASVAGYIYEGTGESIACSGHGTNEEAGDITGDAARVVLLSLSTALTGNAAIADSKLLGKVTRFL